MNEISDIDYGQVIHLIKSILSLEYCLQYQIVPLALKQGGFILGMVDAEDKSALDFVRPIINALGYNLTIKCIDSYTHQLILAEYLKNTYSSEETKAHTSSQASARNLRDSAMTMTSMPFDPQQNSRQKELDCKATITFDLSENPFSTPKGELKAEPSYGSRDSTLNSHHEPVKNIEPDFPRSAPSVKYCLTHDYLNTLTPRELWQELFAKMIDGSIDKLCLERHRQQGSILCSQAGEVQSCLDNVSLFILQALISEIKTLAKIPLEPLQKIKKVALEKHYQQERLQLRIDACPGEWGDEITIQVLRGKALKLYERKQIKKMSDQALLLAEKLAKTLTTMRKSFDPSQIGDLHQLKQVKQEIDRQLMLIDRSSGKQ